MDNLKKFRNSGSYKRNVRKIKKQLNETKNVLEMEPTHARYPSVSIIDSDSNLLDLDVPMVSPSQNSINNFVANISNEEPFRPMELNNDNDDEYDALREYFSPEEDDDKTTAT